MQMQGQPVSASGTITDKVRYRPDEDRRRAVR